ncbi:MAG TPA: hypothetical protein VLI67_04645, partial [Vicinamibacteria bacterium]|nr:hypothetical protein [Vicinamibacteria bacterium]
MSRRSPFLDLRPAEVRARAAAREGRFLGRLDAAALRRDLEEAGLLAGLAARGYAAVSLRTSVEGGEDRL